MPHSDTSVAQSRHNDPPEVVTKISPSSVQDTVSRLEAVLSARGVKLFTVIDQAAAARAVGLNLRETKLVLFGSPKAGTPVMEAVPVAALDLPLKAVVWADDDTTKVSYTDPRALAARYDLPGELAGPLAGITSIVDAVIDR
jgi:uncharacterized protein (DUF302 family)